MAIGTLNRLVGFFGQLDLKLALYLDCFMGHFEGGQHIIFGYFLGFAFDHQDVFDGGGNDQVKVCLFLLSERGVDNILNANTAGTIQLQLRSEIATSAVTLLGGSVWLKYRTIS
jgi:hypothetical protein